MKINVQSSMLSQSSTSAEYSWYEYKGPTFVVQSATSRLTVTEGDQIGLCPIARQTDYYLVVPSAPKKKYKVTPQRVAKVTKTSRKLRRVVIAGEPRTDAVNAVLDNMSTQRWDSERFKPAVPPRNESFGRSGDAEGVNTKNYQWRVVREPILEVRTTKTVLKFKRGDVFGIRFIKETQGGKIVDLNGMYETLPTESYDYAVANTKLVPHGNWPATTVTPERIAEYQEMKDRKKRQDRRAKEAEERAQQVAQVKSVKNANAEIRQAEAQKRAKDAAENHEITKQVLEFSKQEAAKQAQVQEERKAQVGETIDEELRKMRASNMKPLSEVMTEDEADDDEDFGEEVEVPEDGKQKKAPVNKLQDAAEDAGAARADGLQRLANALNTLRAATKADEAADKALRAEYTDAVKKLKASDAEGVDEIVAEWEQRVSGGADEAEPEAGADAGNDEGADDSATDDQEPVDEEGADSDGEYKDPTDEELADDEATWYEPSDDDFAEGKEVVDDFDPNEEDDADFDEEEEIPDEDEEPVVDEDADAEDEEPVIDEDADAEDEEPVVDEDDGFGDGAAADIDLDADQEDDETSPKDDSDGIAKGLIGEEGDQDFDDDEAVDDLADVDEEDIDAEPKEGDVPVAKPAPKKPAAKEEPDVADEDLDIEDEEEETHDLPKAAGVKKSADEVDEGALITFHDDAKLKRRWLVLEVKPNAINDRVLEYKLWEYDDKPEETRVTRVNTGRQQSLLSRADKVGELTPKEFNAARAIADNYDENNEPIKS